jgi:hypothetical protein
MIPCTGLVLTGQADLKSAQARLSKRSGCGEFRSCKDVSKPAAKAGGYS